MSTNPAKRTRFDASAISPTDRAATSMAAAKQALEVHCASLQPEIATILTKLGLERLQLLHKLAHKTTQVSKIEDDPEFIPRSARIQFALSASKSVEEDAEYKRLKDETSELVTNFQAALKTKILAVAKLEVSHLKTKLRTEFARSFRLAIDACLICENTTPQLSTDQIANTLLNEHTDQLLTHLELSLDEFRTIYTRTHTLTILPTPIALRIPERALTNTARNQNQNLPPQATLLAITKIFRTIDSTLLSPWSTYLDVKKRNDVSLRLKKLSDTHFTTSATDEASMIIDSEPSADPQLIKDLIQKQVTTATKALQSEIKSLRSQLPTHKAPKNSQRGSSRASNKNKNGKQATAADNDTPVAKPKSSQRTSSNKKSTKPSKSKPGNISRRKKTSKTASSKS